MASYYGLTIDLLRACPSSCYCWQRPIYIYIYQQQFSLIGGQIRTLHNEGAGDLCRPSRGDVKVTNMAWTWSTEVQRNMLHRTDWHSGNALDLHSGGVRFEYRSGGKPAIMTGSSWFPSVPPGKCRDNNSLDHDRLLPNPFQFIIHLSPCHSTLYSLDIDSVLK
jgi:hypothetical protein